MDMSQDIQILPNSGAERMPFDWGELTWYANGALGNSEGLTVGRCVLKPGRSNPRHYHPNCTEVLTVLKGRIRHTGPGGNAVELSEGDTVTVPPNIWHNAENTGDSEAVLSIVFNSPDRQTIGE